MENSYQSIICAIKQIGIDISRVLRTAPISGHLGRTNSLNSAGDKVQKMDLIANDIFKNHLIRSKACYAIVSEENLDVTLINPDGEYILMIDPLDGSSNIDVGVSVGSIFGIYLRKSQLNLLENCLQKGSELVGAGYILYGTSTSLVLADPNTANAYLLDPIKNKYVNTGRLYAPDSGNIYSINEANFFQFPEGLKNYLRNIQLKNISGKNPVSSRYIGSLVADFHRNLIKGGVFIYPGTKKHVNGKLRLTYEINPLAFILKAAGGVATNGETDILNIPPQDIHQKTTVLMGSRLMVNDIMAKISTKQSRAA